MTKLTFVPAAVRSVRRNIGQRVVTKRFGVPSSKALAGLIRIQLCSKIGLSSEGVAESVQAVRRAQEKPVLATSGNVILQGPNGEPMFMTRHDAGRMQATMNAL